MAVDVSRIRSARWAEDLLLTLASDYRERPRFSASWVVPTPPPDGILVHSYAVEGSDVRLYRVPSSTESFYFVAPWEYALPPAQVRLVHLAREELKSSPPPAVRLDRPDDVRAYVAKLG